jgi:hypothetical protein
MQQRTEQIGGRLTKAECAEVKEIAESAGLSKSQAMRLAFSLLVERAKALAPGEHLSEPTSQREQRKRDARNRLIYDAQADAILAGYGL